MFKVKPSGPAGPRSTVAIKRVLRQGGRFTCGVCRKSYGDEASAERCLARCLQAHLNPASTVAAEPGGKRFRCHFCKRVHNAREDAKRCAAACRGAAEEKVVKEASIKAATGGVNAVAIAVVRSSDASAGSAAGIVEKIKKPKAAVRRNQEHKYLRDGRKLVCRKCGKEFPTLDTVIACYDAHPDHVKSERRAPAALTPAVTSPATRSSAEDAAKFLRDGAKYVCRHCHKKTFTRDDVIACFDGHANEPKIASVPVAAEPIAAAPVEKVVRPDDDHKFFRDGAKYVCRTCSKKYFTRGDVGACFDAHAAV